MKFLHRTMAFVRFLLRSKGLHRVHSPFVFHLYHKLIRENDHYYCFDTFYQLRESLCSSTEIIHRSGIGASGAQKTRKLAEIARATLSTDHWCRIYFRMINHYRPQYVLELGTGTGLCSLYLASAAPNSTLITLEGDPEMAKVARQTFKLGEVNNIQLVEGLFEHTLPNVLHTLPRVDFALIDGNHTYAATMQHFHQLLGKVHAESILVFDDIHWSAGMSKAWKEIKNHPSVLQTIDFYRVGMVFFRKQQVKQHFILRASPTGI